MRLDPKRSAFFLLALLIVSVMPAALKKPEDMTVELVPQPYTIEKCGEYHCITMEGFYTRAPPGNPALPQKIFDIELSSHAQLDTVDIEIISIEKDELEGFFDIGPGPLLAAQDMGSIQNGKNPPVYNTDAFYPQSPVTIMRTHQIKDKKYVRIQFTPFQYNPQTKKLMLNKVTLKILWYTTIKKYTAPAPPGIGYVIVTTNTVVNNSLKLQSFFNYLQLQGFTVYIITENQYGVATGQQRAINIRNWLISNYSTLNIKYVLLIGNPDPDDPGTSDSFGDIPMMMCWPNPGSTPDQTPTDYFYADLTGNWDSDGDGFYGEFGEDTVDFGPEVYVGRIPVYGNYTALDSILTKFITYTGANTSIMLPMAISNYQNEENVSNGCVTGWARTDGLNLPQHIIQNLTSPLGYTDYVMYETAGVTGRGHDPVTPAAFKFKAPITNANVIAQWPNDYGIVFWWAHGSQTSSSRKYWSNDANSNFAVEDGVCETIDELTWPNLLTSADTAGLPNTETFTFQCSCYNGYPENSQNLQYSLLKQGAVSTVGSTRICWYAQGTWTYTGIVDDTGIGYTYVWFLVFGQSAGEALYNGKSSLTNPWGWQGWQNLFDFNLYGDPSMYLEGPRVIPPEPPPGGDPKPPPDYSRIMCPLTNHRIKKAEDLIEEAEKLLEEAENAGFDVSDIAEDIAEAKDILEMAKKYCLGHNCIAGNYLAIIATEMLIQAIEKLREMV